MFDKLFKLKKSGEPQQISSTVRVIGPRSSGKTTYMAALARWPNADPTVSPVQSVIPLNDDGEELIAKAKNLLEQGEQLLPTGREGIDLDLVKDYSLRIVLKEQFSWQNLSGKRLISLDINCKDYAGEFLQDIIYQSGTLLLEDYLDDCLKAEGIMLLLDGMGYRQDGEYANGVNKLLKEMDRASVEVSHRRIAFIITKCEQPELWVNRHQPDKIIKARFPQVLRELQAWEQSGPGSIGCFTTSAFGTVGNRFPEPNMNRLTVRREGITAILKHPRRWKPFGLVAPIYWLCTGERHAQLDIE